jgi:hypothetical protein
MSRSQRPSIPTSDIRGKYPHYNISVRLIEANERRLDAVGEAGKHADTYRRRFNPKEYGHQEP